MRARATLVAASVALAATAGAQIAPGAPASGSSASAEAAQTLRRAQALVGGGRQWAARRDLTLQLMRLVRAYPSLDAAGRRTADRLLARPTERNDPEGNAWRVREAGPSPACSANFCVHWVARSRDAPRLADANGSFDGDGIPDYVELTLFVAEQTHTVENDRLRWREPQSDRRRGGRRGKTDIYLSDLGGGFFGYAAPDRGQAGRGHRFPRSLYSYLVIDDDFRRGQFPGKSPAAYLAVTLAHEYDHVLQFSYDALQDVWLAESVATWMEDQVFDPINDYRRYLRRWVRRLSIPLTASSIKVYGSAVWNQWLAHRYGPDLIRRVWSGAQRARPAGFSVAAYRRAIRRAGRSGFNADFARFSRDVAEWRTGTVFPEGRSYPDLARSGRLRYGSPRVRRLNHTTFELLGLRPAHAKAVRVTVRVRPSAEAALALVGRIGRERRGRVVSRFRFRRRAGRISLRLRHPGRFSRLTAVIVNADTRQRGFSRRRFDWDYARNRVPFTVSARLAR